MQTTHELKDALKNNLKFLNLFQRQASDAEIDAMQVVSTLFMPYLDAIKAIVTEKPGYILNVTPWLHEVPNSKRQMIYEVRFDFFWEPQTQNLQYHEVFFNKKEMIVVADTLERFSHCIELPVALD
jgi:hypothetical protein